MAPDSPPSPGGTTLLRLEGADAVALVHRISTQFLDDLPPGAARRTLFCEFRGRLLHRVAVARTRDGVLWLARADAPGGELLEHLDKHMFREDVRSTDLGAEWTVRAVEDKNATPGTVRETNGRPERIALDAGHVLVIEPAGATTAADPAGELAAELARIRAGQPRHGHEIAIDFTPFEVGLAHEVHLQKGCFTGQEALMRLVTYKSVRRALARIDGQGEPPAVRTDVLLDERSAGPITSVASDGKSWSALAVLRHEAFEPGVILEVPGTGVIEAPVAFPLTQPLGIG